MNNNPVYIDALIENDDDLEAKFGFESVLTETADITQEGVIAVHATGKLRNRNKALAIFLLTPNM